MQIKRQLDLQLHRQKFRELRACISREKMAGKIRRNGGRGKEGVVKGRYGIRKKMPLFSPNVHENNIDEYRQTINILESYKRMN